MPKQKYKYRIKEIFSQMPENKCRFATQIIALKLGIPLKTFEEWQNIKMRDKQDIGAQALETIAKFLEYNENDLKNYKVKIEPLRKLEKRLAELVVEESQHL